MSKTYRLSAFGTLERQESHVAEILQDAAKAQRSKEQEKDVLEFHEDEMDLTGKVVVVVPKVTSDKLHKQLSIKRDLNPQAKKAMKLAKTEMDQSNSFFIGDYTEPQPPRRVIQSFVKSNKKNDPYNIDNYR